MVMHESASAVGGRSLSTSRGLVHLWSAPVRVFELLVFLLASGLVAFVLSFAGAGLGDRPGYSLLDAAFWVIATALVEFLPVPIWKSLQVGTGFPLFTAVAFLYSPGLAGVIAFLGSSDPRELRRKVRPLRALFNRSQLTLSLLAASAVFHGFGVEVSHWSRGLLLAVPAAVLVFYLCNVTLVSTALSLEHRVAFWSVFRRMRIGNPLEFLISYLGLGLLGVTLARLYVDVGWWAVAAFVMPLLLARQMFFRTRALEDATAELKDREVVLRALSNRMAEERQDERKQIAGYLHDDLAQVLYRMALHLDISEKQLEKGQPEKAREEIAGLRESRDRAMQLIRALIKDLHRSPLGRAGLSEALNSYAHEVERDTGVRMRTALQDIEMAPPIQLLCYHVAREAVMNAVKHAEASAITITLEPTAEGARLSVADDGRGFDAEAGEPEGHYGLTMMRERAQVSGGTFKIDSAEGRGTTVIADFPTSWMVATDGRPGRPLEQSSRERQA
jgi:signal transduction histidine kinase